MGAALIILSILGADLLAKNRAHFDLVTRLVIAIAVFVVVLPIFR